MTDLLPCPLCGGKAKLSYIAYGCTEDSVFFIKCEICGLTTRDYHSYDYRVADVINDWNRRYEPKEDDLK